MRCGISFQEIALQLNAAFEFYSTLYAAMLKVLSHFENKKSHQNKKRNGRRRQEESMTLNGRTWKIKNTKQKNQAKAARRKYDTQRTHLENIRRREAQTKVQTKLNQTKTKPIQTKAKPSSISDAEGPRPRSNPN